MVTKQVSRLQRLARVLDPVELQARARGHGAQGHRFKAFGLMQLAIFVHTAKGLRDEEITRRAAALTYHTLLSIVPVLAVGFALFKAFGGLQKMEGPLRAIIVENLSVGRSQEVGRWLEQFIANINAGAIAGVGLLFLFYSAVGLLSNIEGAFNRIWGVERPRPLHMRFAIYWCVLTLAPPLIGLSLSLSARLQSSVFATTVQEWLPFGLGRLLVSGGSVMSACLVLVFLYQLVPHTKVRLRSALLGGTVAGLLWTGSKVLFLWATAGSVKYSAVYGALGVLPLLMVWIYLSWIIVLFGVTFTYANQSLVSGNLQQGSDRSGQMTRDAVALRVMLTTAQAFRSGTEAPTVEMLAEACGLPADKVRPVVDTLVELRFLAEVGAERQLAPARTLASINVAELLEALHEHPTPLSRALPEQRDPLWIAVCQTLADFKPSEHRRGGLSLEALSMEIAPAFEVKHDALDNEQAPSAGDGQDADSDLQEESGEGQPEPQPQA